MFPIKILSVDDEAPMESMMKQFFRRKIRSGEYEFYFARNGVEALDVLNNTPGIEIILLDINMPEMDGLTMLSKVKEMHNPALHVIMVSAYGDLTNIRQAMNNGAFDFVMKPIDLGNFRLEAVHCPGHTEGTTSFFFEATYRGERVNCAIHGGLGAGVLTDSNLEAMGLRKSLREDYLVSIEKVLDRPVDVVLPSHAGHPVGYDFFGIADSKPGAGDTFVDKGAWKRMLTAKRAEIVKLIENSKL